MNWLSLALLAPALDTVILYIDRYIIEREITDYQGLPVYSALVGIIAGTMYWIVTDFPFLSPRDGLIIVSTGILSVWGLAIYYKALAREETSRIIIFFKAIPIIILILSFAFLKETITLKQLCGFIIILTATVGVSLKTEKKKKTGTIFSTGLGLIILVDILWALAAVLVKFAINLNSFAKIISYESWGVGLGGIALYFLIPSVRKAFILSLKKVRKFALLILFINEGIFLISKAVTFYAYSLGPTSLISVIGASQVFYGIWGGFILTKSIPSIFHEDIRSKTMFQKLFFACVLIIGISLVS
jgi:drug/metabolite transporter (DMT)-like permease